MSGLNKSGSKKVVAFDSDKKGIKRVVHIFQDIILPRTTPISTKQIHEQLIAEGYDISRCQLNRILNMYSRDFGVDRADLKDEHGSNYWLSTKTSARMSQAEVILYITMVEHIGLDKLEASLPKESRELLRKQLERTFKPIETSKNTHQKLLITYQQNTRLLCTYDKQQGYCDKLLTNISAALNNSLNLEITSSELPPDTVVVITPISLSEKEGELYIRVDPKFCEGTKLLYCVSKIISAKCVDPTQALFNRPRR